MEELWFQLQHAKSLKVITPILPTRWRWTNLKPRKKQFHQGVEVTRGNHHFEIWRKG